MQDKSRPLSILAGTDAEGENEDKPARDRAALQRDVSLATDLLNTLDAEGVPIPKQVRSKILAAIKKAHTPSV